jgi:hypothetical protein
MLRSSLQICVGANRAFIGHEQQVLRTATGESASVTGPNRSSAEDFSLVPDSDMVRCYG